MRRGAMYKISAIVVLVSFSFLSGCSSPNSQSPFDPETGHAANWLPAAHMNAARTDLASCNQCHGEDLSRVISGVRCTLCHRGGPTAVHPADWRLEGHPSHLQ